MLSFSVFFSCDTSYICMFDNLIIYPSSLIAYLLIFCLFFYPCFIFNIFQCCLWFHWFFKYKLIYFNWRLITLQYCVGSAIHQHRYTRVPHPEPPSLLPPRTIPLGHLSAPAPNIQYHASNLDWRFISSMILYMFQCHSPKSCHPLPLPQSPQDCSIHLCLFCCLYSHFGLPWWLRG